MTISTQVTVYSTPKREPYAGFIYIWRNSISGKFYIGSHIGHVDDGYVGSGKHFRNSYKKTPHLFKRRILEYVCGDLSQTLDREEYWLSLAKKNPDRHYNKIYRAVGLHPASYDVRATQSFRKKGRKWYTDGINDWMLHVNDDRTKGLILGRTNKSESLSSVNNSKTIWITNGLDEKRINIECNIPYGWNHGRCVDLCDKMQKKIVSTETKDKIREANVGLTKSAATKRKLSDSKLGRKWFHNGLVSKLSHTHPGDGWIEGRK